MTAGGPCDLAALVYDAGQDPDAVLSDVAGALRAQGSRVVGLVQRGHRDGEAPQLTAVLLQTGAEMRLFQDLGPGSAGCKLDVGQLLAAGHAVAGGIDDGADLVIINRFGKQEREGRGLAYLIERALSRGIPVVIAVPSHRLADWIAFAGDLGTHLPCDREATLSWFATVSPQRAIADPLRQDACAAAT